MKAVEAKAPPADGQATRAEEGDLPLQIVDGSAQAEAREKSTKAGSGPGRNRLVFAFLLIAGAGIAFALSPQWRAKIASTPANDLAAKQENETGRIPEGTLAERIAPGLVAGLGKLIPRGHIITLAPPFGASDARIAQLKVAEGQHVEAGTILAVLDSEANFQAAIASAEAVVAAREAGLAQTKLLTSTGLEAARAMMSRAEAAAETTRRDLDRTEALVARGNATDQVQDQRRLAYRQATQDVEQARSTFDRYNYSDISQHPDVLVAERNLQSARADLKKAQADLEKAYVRAPTAGTVLTIAARAGEKPGSQGLMTFGDLSNMIAEIEIYEDQIGVVAEGMEVTLTADALPRPLAGHVDQVGVEVLRQTLTDASPAANTDTRVIRVKVALDEASRRLAERFANLQVTARFKTGSAR